MLRTFSITMLLSGIVAVSSYAQTDQPIPDRGRSNELNSKTQSSNRNDKMDEKVAACFVLAHANEIALAEHAQGKVQDATVKQFVTKLVSDHEKALAKANQFAPSYATVNLTREGRTVTDDRSQQGESRRLDGSQAQFSRSSQQRQDELNRDNADPNRTTDQTVTSDLTQARSGEMEKTWFEIEKDAAQRCLEMTKQELDRTSGSKFDKAFVGSQVGGHIHLISKLEAVQPHVSEQMRPFIDECLTSAKHHLQEARNLCETLEQRAGTQN